MSSNRVAERLACEALSKILSTNERVMLLQESRAWFEMSARLGSQVFASNCCPPETKAAK